MVFDRKYLKFLSGLFFYHFMLQSLRLWASYFTSLNHSIRKMSEIHIICPAQPLGNSEHLINNWDYYSLLFSFFIFLDGTTQNVPRKGMTPMVLAH